VGSHKSQSTNSHGLKPRGVRLRIHHTRFLTACFCINSVPHPFAVFWRMGGKPQISTYKFTRSETQGCPPHTWSFSHSCHTDRSHTKGRSCVLKGTTLVVPNTARNHRGFSPRGAIFHKIRASWRRSKHAPVFISVWRPRRTPSFRCPWRLASHQPRQTQACGQKPGGSVRLRSASLAVLPWV